MAPASMPGLRVQSTRIHQYGDERTSNFPGVPMEGEQGQLAPDKGIRDICDAAQESLKKYYYSNGQVETPLSNR